MLGKIVLLQTVPHVGHRTHLFEKLFSFFDLKTWKGRDKERRNTVRFQIQQRSADAVKDIHDIDHRHLLIIEQIDQSVHHKELRIDAPDECEQSVGDGNIELVTGIRPRHIGTVQEIIRIDLFHPRKFCEQVRIDAVCPVDNDDARSVHQDLRPDECCQ